MTMSFEFVSSTPARTRNVVIGAIVWLAIALILSIAGLPQKLTPPAPQIVILALTILLIVFSRVYAPLRAWTMSVDLRTLVGFHLLRAVAGVAFVWAAAHGSLPTRFSDVAGYGDIAVAALALVLVTFVAPHRSSAPLLYVIWNTLGLIDIMLAVVIATRIAMADPSAMAQLLKTPFSLIPLFLVPIVITSHIWLFERLLRRTGVGT
jgi:hypothetical protein